MPKSDTVVSGLFLANVKGQKVWRTKYRKLDGSISTRTWPHARTSTEGARLRALDQYWAIAAAERKEV